MPDNGQKRIFKDVMTEALQLQRQNCESKLKEKLHIPDHAVASQPMQPSS